MNPMLSKLMKLKKKPGKELPETEKDGKLSAIKSFSDMADQALKKKVTGLKKVTVAASSPEALKEGLEKAEELVEDVDAEEAPETEEVEAEEPKVCDESSSLEEVDAEIERLMALKKEKEAEEA